MDPRSFEATSLGAKNVSLIPNSSLQRPEEVTVEIPYHIEKLVDSKRNEAGKLIFKARWVTYTWVSEESLVTCQHLVQEYWEEKAKADADADKRPPGRPPGKRGRGRPRKVVQPPEEQQDESEDHAARAASPTDGLEKDDEKVTSETRDRSKSPTGEGFVKRYSLRAPKEKPWMEYLIPGKKIRFEHEGEIKEGFVKSEWFESDFMCDDCGIPFETEEDLKDHCDRHASGELKNDVESPTPLGDTYEINMEEQDERKRAYTCKLCHNTFKGRLDAKNHQRVHEGTNPWYCRKCDKHFLRKYKFARHMLMHSGTKQFECDHCGKRFNGPDYLRRHKATYCSGNSQNLLACSVCSVTFSEKRLLEAHEAIHAGTNPFHCEICDKHFLKKHTYKNHMAIHDGTRPFSCSICGRGFIQKSDMQRHEKTHEDVNPLRCDACFEEFDLPEDLEMHFEMSETCKPHTCDVCDKAFGSLGHLRRHLLTHSKSRPSPCVFCEKNFAAKADLDRHLAVVHASEKKFKCPHCTEEFHTKDRLHSHKTRFHGHLIETFKCAECDKVFGEETNYHRHVRMAHMKDKLYSCDACDRCFKTRSELSRHLVTGKHLKTYAERRADGDDFMTDEDSLDFVSEQHKCAICEKVFHNETELHRHELVHQRVQISAHQEITSDALLDSLPYTTNVATLKEASMRDTIVQTFPRVVQDTDFSVVGTEYHYDKDSSLVPGQQTDIDRADSITADCGGVISSSISSMVASLVGNDLVISTIPVEGLGGVDSGAAMLQFTTATGQPLSMTHDQIQQIIQQALLSQSIVLDDKQGQAVSGGEESGEIIYLHRADEGISDGDSLGVHHDSAMRGFRADVKGVVVAGQSMTEEQAVFAAAIDSLAQASDHHVGDGSDTDCESGSHQTEPFLQSEDGSVPLGRTQMRMGASSALAPNDVYNLSQTALGLDAKSLGQHLVLSPETLQRLASGEIVYQVESSSGHQTENSTQIH